jgi:hypothetical protein
MGKRELGLILAFVVAGMLVWQVTAPKAEGPGFSFSDFFANARREIRGRNASAEVTTAPVIPVDASIAELRLTLRGDVTIVGEDREDVASELKVESNGHDEAEAKKLAAETTLKVSRFADSVVVAFEFPEPGRQQARLTLHVPRRLRLQLDGRGTAAVTGMDTVTLSRTSGQVEIKNTGGLVKGEHRGGTLTNERSQPVDMYSVSSETSIRDVREDVRLNIRTGEATLTGTRGQVTVTSGDATVRFEKPAGPVRAELVDSELEMRDVAGSVDIDARETPVTIAWARPAPAKIQAREGNVEMVLPQESATYSLDVRMTEGDIRVPESLQKTTEGAEQVVMKTAAASAPAIFVRGTGSTITIR